jgi:hypothetical protein
MGATWDDLGVSTKLTLNQYLKASLSRMNEKEVVNSLHGLANLGTTKALLTDRLFDKSILQHLMMDNTSFLVRDSLVGFGYEFKNDISTSYSACE